MSLQAHQEALTRIRSAAIVAIVHLLLAYAFLAGLHVDLPIPLPDRLQLLRLSPETLPPPPPAKPAPAPAVKAVRVRPKDPEGAASPANLRNAPTEIVAPKPVVPLPVPPILPVAPVAGTGNAPAAGAADRPGPGTGSGGQGNGLGSGTRGNGTGGGGGGRGSPVRWLSGEIDESDYPRGADDAGISGTVGLRFVVAPDGRVSECRITRSSGNAELDAATCRLILRRFRYRPARDAQGKAIAATITGEHDWRIRRERSRDEDEEPYR